jgi:hypothetical protein
MAQDPKQDEPATQTTPTTGVSTEVDEGAPFVDDIIIWQDGLDVPRKLTQQALEALPKLSTSMLPTINSLIKQGVTIAAIPTNSGIGAACYLVNLETLKRPDGSGDDDDK